jgi:hypothetical protein
MNLLDKANIITTPTAYSEGKLHSVKPEIALGPELVTNGDFSQSGTATTNSYSLGWYSPDLSDVVIASNVITIYNVSGGRAYATDGSSSTSIVTSGKNYRLTYTILENNGVTVFTYHNGGAYVSAPSSVGTHIIDYTAFGGVFILRNNSVGANIVIDNVSIKEDISADFDFTRGSSATRVNEAGLIESVAANLPRINYENGIGHLLLEPQRTNLLTYSEDFSNAAWAKPNLTVNANQAISPDGSLNASLIVPKTNTSAKSIGNSVGISSGTYTLSVFAKQGGYKNLLVWFDTHSGGVGVNLDDLSVFRDEINDGYKIESFSNGWVRISVTCTISAFAPPNIYVYNNSAIPEIVYAGDGTSGVYIWGAQVEAGSYGTSYIVSNSGSATTRLAETCNNAGNSDIIPSDEGVLYAEIAALANDLTQRHIAISDGSDSDVVRIHYHTTSNSIRGQIRAGGSIEASLTHIVPDIKDFHKVAISYKENDVKLYVDGVLILTETSASMPTGLGKLAFDNGNSINPFYGKTRMVAVFPYLSNDELECLTGEGYASFEALAAAYNYTTI